MRRTRVIACFVLSLVVMPGTSPAQTFLMDLPLKSQGAQVSQTIGLTDVTISYHRPLVGGRQVWDSLVPYGQVWRAGANINTTIAFSDPVTIDGKPLDKGTYGLHMIPRADTWTVIFSRNATSWGSFTYDSAEDALRITVKPAPAEMHEALTYDFVDVQPTSAVVTMQWARLAVPFTVGVNVHDVVAASMKRQLRSLNRFNWLSWNEAATYILAQHEDLGTALAYADTSILNDDRFDNELTRSQALTALNRRDDAAAAQKKALALATPAEADGFARQLLAQKRSDEAFAIFRANAQRGAEWFVHDGLARAYSAQHKFGDAEKEMKLAVATAPASQKSDLTGLIKRLEAKQDINQ